MRSKEGERVENDIIKRAADSPLALLEVIADPAVALALGFPLTAFRTAKRTRGLRLTLPVKRPTLANERLALWIFEPKTSGRKTDGPKAKCEMVNVPWSFGATAKIFRNGGVRL